VPPRRAAASQPLTALARCYGRAAAAAAWRCGWWVDAPRCTPPSPIARVPNPGRRAALHLTLQLRRPHHHAVAGNTTALSLPARRGRPARRRSKAARGSSVSNSLQHQDRGRSRRTRWRQTIGAPVIELRALPPTERRRWARRSGVETAPGAGATAGARCDGPAASTSVRAAPRERPSRPSGSPAEAQFHVERERPSQPARARTRHVASQSSGSMITRRAGSRP
jgi:hypothetical protein